MATYQDIVRRALLRLGVTPLGESMTAEEAQHGMDVCNDMLHSWALRGTDVGHVTATLTTTVRLPDFMHAALVACLAERLAPDFMVAAPDAREDFRTLQNYYLQIPTVRAPSALLNAPSRRDGWRGEIE